MQSACHSKVDSPAKPYSGPIRMVVFDWAGTTVDCGCCAPAVAFVEVFRRYGVEISMEQARAPMGIQKDQHLRAIARLPPVEAAWRRNHGGGCTDADLDTMFRKHAAPLLLECAGRHANLISGTVEAVADLRARGIRIGATTGYSAAEMEVVSQRAREQGYEPDTCACASDVPCGRPEPWMLFANMRQARVFPPQAVVKVGDTRADIAEGLNAGAWTIGVARTGNEVGLTEAELATLPKDVIDRKVARALETLAQAGAHYVADSVAEVVPIVSEIERRLRSGEQP